MNSGLSQEEIDVLSTSATDLLRSIGLGDAFRFERLSGGRNNRVYAVTGREGKAVLKWYFQDEDDVRNRMAAECAFYGYAVECGVTAIAESLAVDASHGLVVYSMIRGRPLAPDEVEPRHVEQAIHFIRKLNNYRNWSISDGLAVASEACFSLRAHIDCVSARVERLQSINAETVQHREARELVQTTIAPALARVTGELEHWARGAGFDLAAPLRNEQKCVSPSDFGFHNALLTAGGQLTFYDFEYGGWDDPAKLLCDFFCQPEIPAPRETWQRFADLTAELAGDTPLERQRQALLLPLYQVKWCCIVLNEFVATDQRRRQFAAQQPADLALQLEKARRLAERLN